MRISHGLFLSLLAFGSLSLYGCDGCSSSTQTQTTSVTPPSVGVQPGPKVDLNWPPPIPGAADPNLAVNVDDVMADNWEIVFDNSGSMDTHDCSGKDTRIVGGGKAVIDFADRRPAGDNIGLVVFTGSSPYAKVVVPLGHDRAALAKTLRSLHADQNTPLGPAIRFAYNDLTAQARKQGGYGSYHLLVVTDGEWNQGEDPEPLAREIVLGSPVQIHVVGFCTGKKHSLNIPGYTGYVSAENAEQVDKGLKAIVENESLASNQ